MRYLGHETVGSMYEDKKKRYLMKNPEEVLIEENLVPPTPNRFIISQNSYMNMIKNDIAFALFICYSIYLPVVICFSTEISTHHQKNLYLFDLIFVLDRFSDLFVGFVNKKGVIENSVLKTIMNNLSFEIFLEILITLAPTYFIDENN